MSPSNAGGTLNRATEHETDDSQSIQPDDVDFALEHFLVWHAAPSVLDRGRDPDASPAVRLRARLLYVLLETADF